jgi:hypothetical protein
MFIYDLFNDALSAPNHLESIVKVIPQYRFKKWYGQKHLWYQPQTLSWRNEK